MGGVRLIKNAPPVLHNNRGSVQRGCGCRLTFTDNRTKTSSEHCASVGGVLLASPQKRRYLQVVGRKLRLNGFAFTLARRHLPRRQRACLLLR